MYVARALSMYRRNTDPGQALVAAEGGPHSGSMVTNGEMELKGSRKMKSLPLPQNAILRITYSDEEHQCLFLPVLDQPLSSNRYYVIYAQHYYKGLAIRCSTEEDITYCCARRIMGDVEPTRFDYRDEYQQFEICTGDRGFYAKPIVPDSFPPSFLRYGFNLSVKSSKVYHLDDAEGINGSLLNLLPELNSTLIIGKWYTPFVFVKGDGPIEVQLKKSLFYTITLEKHWQKIYSQENDGSKGNAIYVDVSIPREVNFLFGKEASKDGGIINDGFIWFRVNDHTRQVKVGLSLAVVEKMRWLEEASGWVDGVTKIERLETAASGNGWTRFCCYVLVDSFVLRRMDGTPVLRCDFRHTNEIQTKWE